MNCFLNINPYRNPHQQQLRAAVLMATASQAKTAQVVRSQEKGISAMLNSV
jgi:hypothetical protein